MAFITAETRSDIIALVVTMLNRAPDSALLNTLVTASTSGKSLAEVADLIAATDEFTAENSASQTAKEYATAALDRAFQGATVTADLRTAAIDLAVTYLNDGMSKAALATVINDFLALPSTLENEDFGNIAAAFANKNTVAEYYVLDADLGGQTVAELAAAIANVTDEAASVTTATAAADSEATSATSVAGQTFTLTTGVDSIRGTLADETFSAPASNPTTGVAATIFNSGDVIDGGAGTDTLNITMTSANNNSLAGVTVKNVENVYVTGANFQTSGTTGAALAAATAAKAATAASLTAAQAAGVTATQQDSAAQAVTAAATSAAQTGVAGSLVGGIEGEDAVLQLASATVASAASTAAAATAIAALAGGAVTTAAGLTATVNQTNLTAAAVTAYTGAEYLAAAVAATTDSAGATITVANTIQDRATLLQNVAETNKTLVDATQQDQATAVQLQAAADAVDALTTEVAVLAASTAALPAGITTFTKAQYNAVALASMSADSGATLITAGNDDATITARAAVLAAEAAAVVTFSTSSSAASFAARVSAS